MRESFYRAVVVALLILNTFFLGSIWKMMACSSSADCGGKKKFCPFTSGSAGKVCPITGKPLRTAE